MIKKYVRKPIVVQAMLYTDFDDRHEFIVGAFNDNEYVTKGNYIIKNSEGIFSVCHPDIFQNEYAEVLGETE